MAAFVYFFPQPNVTTVDRIPPECGLSDVLKGASLGFRQVENFQGHAGTMVAVHPTPKSGGTEADCLYKPDGQTWLPVESEDGKLLYFVGYDNGSKPTPADLIRPDSCGGNAVELDYETYLVPTVHYAGCMLPQRYRFVKGKMSREIDSRYQALMLQAHKMVLFYAATPEQHANKEVQPITHDEAFEFAVGCLAINYRVDKPELCLLDLLTTHTALKVIEAGLGFTAYEEEKATQKKSG